MRNLTTARVNVQVPAGQSESVEWKFATELHPQDLVLKIFAVVTNEEGLVATLQAHEGGVSVVEADVGWFDPQL